MNKKLDALMKTYEGVESVAVIHSDEKPSTVAFVEVSAKMSTDEKLERAFMLTNSVKESPPCLMVKVVGQPVSVTWY